MQQSYKFKNVDFGEGGFNKEGVLFIDIMQRWEEEFHKELYPFFANHIYANYSTMRIIKSCFQTDSVTDFGMDGELDFDENYEMEGYSGRKTIFAFGSQLEGNMNNPLYLVMDSNIKDGSLILKCISDGEGNEDEPVKVFDNGMRRQVRC
jgi:hypothetical protein